MEFDGSVEFDGKIDLDDFEFEDRTPVEISAEEKERMARAAEEAEYQRAVAAGEKETAVQRFDRHIAEHRASEEAAKQKRISLFGRDVPEPSEEMYNYYDRLEPQGQQNAARMRLEKIGIEATEDNIRAEIRIGLKQESLNDVSLDFAKEWNQRARSQSVVNKDVTIRQSRKQAIEDEAAMRAERFEKLKAERAEQDRLIAERNAAREAAEARYQESIGPARAAREAEAAKKSTSQLRGTMIDPKTSGLTVGTPALESKIPLVHPAEADIKPSAVDPRTGRTINKTYNNMNVEELLHRRASVYKQLLDPDFANDPKGFQGTARNTLQGIDRELTKRGEIVSNLPQPAAFDPAHVPGSKKTTPYLTQIDDKLDSILPEAKTPISVGTPVDDLTKVASITPPMTPPVTTAADMAASVEAKVATAVIDGGASAAGDVVSSAVKKTSTAISGLQPKSAGGVLGLGLALAAGGAGVLYMHKNRGRADYRGA